MTAADEGGSTGARVAATDQASRANGSAPTVSVVFPCLDEVRSVGLCVRRAREAMRVAELSGEVLVVDNGSCDGSGRAAGESGARVVIERERGYGAALRSGIAAARGAVVVTADADCTYDLEQIPEMAHWILDGKADLVIASRIPDGQPIPLFRRVVGVPVLNLLISRASGGPTLADSQSGFRAFRRDAMLGLGLESRGMEFASEMLVRAMQADFRVTEIVSRYGPRVGESKLRIFADGWRHLRLLAMVRRA